MTKTHHLVSLAFLYAVSGAPAAVAAEPVSLSMEAIAPYQTQLFNLLTNQKSILDRKNHYQRAFATQFDTLLASSALAKADKTGVPLKKRLLSGPASEAAVVTDLATGRQFLYFDACQAHMCDQTSLGLLFDPASRRMVGKLTLDRQSEYLGTPSESEKRLIEKKQSED